MNEASRRSRSRHFGSPRHTSSRCDPASFAYAPRVHAAGAGACSAKPEVITAILTALKLPTEAPPIARARDPAELEAA
jgi:hypothetical protein